MIPADDRAIPLLQGDNIHLCEILLPTLTPHGDRFDIPSLNNGRDGFLLQAAIRFSELVSTGDEASGILVDHLSEAVRWHVIEEYGIGLSDSGKAREEPTLPQHTSSLLVTYITDRLATRITLDELAALSGLTTHNLLKRFRATFNTTPGQYIINARIREAQRLLQHSSLQITEVANATGFYSPSHFSTVFSKHVGITPMAYRRQR